MTLSFRAHPLFRLFVSSPKVEPLVAATQGATDVELAHIAEGNNHRIEHFRYDALTLIYGGARTAA